MSKSKIIPFPGTEQLSENLGDTDCLYRLRVEIEDTEPTIYRLLLVRGNIGLDLLHAILQVAVGWTNSHLHKFDLGEVEYSDPEFNLNEDAFEDDKPIENECIVTLQDCAPNIGFQFRYDYDFGDCWGHRITVENILPDDGTLAGFAECIGGKRACPPEDCGGTSGYEHFLEAIHDPENEDHESMTRWMGDLFNPAQFNRAKVNRFLKKIKCPHPTDEQLAKILLERDTIKPVKKKAAKRKSTKRTDK